MFTDAASKLKIEDIYNYHNYMHSFLPQSISGWQWDLFDLFEYLMTDDILHL